MSARHCAPLILRLCPSCIPPPASKLMKASVRRSASHQTKQTYEFETLLIIKHRDGADRRTGALAPFQRQADELKFALPEQRLEIAQAFHMRDVEFEAGFVHECIDFTFRPRPHRVDAEMHNALAGKPL